jgi:hypothetical protein
LLLKALHFPEKEEGESSSSTTESVIGVPWKLI